MKFIEGKELVRQFEKLCKQYRHYEWVVAWASKNELWDVLWEQHACIKKMVVGLHFYQTSPEFIQRYLVVNKVRYIKETDGVFHPKLYLFYNSDQDWAVVMGSSNFTMGGFGKNEEANVLITNKDADKVFLMQIRAYIERLWNGAAKMPKEELDRYKKCCDKQKLRLGNLKYNWKDKSGKFVSDELDMMDWKEYAKTLKRTEGYEVRLKVLRQARELFKKPFGKLTLEERKKLAGDVTENEWSWFGTTGNGVFKQAIKYADKNLCRAIDSIPLRGKIYKDDYMAYIGQFERAVPRKTSKKQAEGPLASATRLLALKRPDMFICVNQKNKRFLSERYGFKQNQLTVDTYWELVVERIGQSVWFKETVGGEDRELKNFQAAMLDGFTTFKE